jgi:hypothetical protein
MPPWSVPVPTLLAVQNVADMGALNNAGRIGVIVPVVAVAAVPFAY